MTREEAIKWLEETLEDTDTYFDSCSDALKKELLIQKDVFEMAISALKNTHGEWISVKDRLPDKPGHYLVCTSINYWHGGCMDKNEEHKYHDSGTPIGYDGTMMSVLDCYYDITGNWNRVFNKHVTHWMPLPEPPEEKEDK